MKQKIINKSNGVVLASFLASAFLMWLIYRMLGFYPYGEKTNLIMDMQGQYCEFLTYIRNIFGKDNSLFFSWSRSMGGNFIGLLSYYIASPLSWITLFFSVENMPLAVFWLTIIKIGLCGMSFAIYLEYAFNERKGKLFVIAFAICYALMSYTMVYSLSIMWLDGIILLPMVMLGIEKLFQGKKGLVFFISIALLFIINYYTGYMIGIFTAIYFVFRAVSTVDKTNWKNILWTAVRFALNTVLAAAVSAPFLLPTIKDLASGKLSEVGYNPNLTFNFEFTKIFTKFLPGKYDSITNSGLPAIFCGVLILLLAVGFLLHNNIKIREKIGAILIVAFLLVSFWIGKLDIAWHGFQYPNWFPYRYAFLLSFFIIYMAYRTFLTFKLNKKLEIILSIAVIAIAGFEMYNNGSKLITGLEAEFNARAVSDYKGFYNKTMPLVKKIQDKDTGFYRMDKNYEFSKNDCMLLGYNGMTHYSSTYNANVNGLTRKLGIAQAYFWNSNYGSTPITDSLFSVKYLLYDKQLPNTYTKISEQDGVTAYENKNVLPIAFSAKTPKEPLDLQDSNPFTNQNDLLNALAGTQEDYFVSVPFSKQDGNGGWKYSFVADSDNPVYLYMRGDNLGYAVVKVNDNYVGTYFSNETNCNLYLGQFKRGQKVSVVCSNASVKTTVEYIYKLDTKLYQKAVKGLADGGLKVTHHKGGKLKGTITVGEDEKIVTSIPYDDGLVVKVDGKKVQKESLENTFLVIPAEKGEHKISISFSCPGFFTGLFVCMIAVLIAIVYYRTKECKRLLETVRSRMNIGKQGENDVED